MSQLVPGLTETLNWVADMEASGRIGEDDRALVETALAAWQDRIEPRLRRAQSGRRHWWV
ncbi:MAG: hypothetical protein GEU91_13560 [Rhizobiales bacterium]|nr:hypothetical protein [Hyphomicrobiales bacterium]